MENTEAFWRVVDVSNLARRLSEAEDAVERADAKIERAQAHLDEAKAAKQRAKGQLEATATELEAARSTVAGLPEADVAEAQADVDRRNLVRDVVVKAMAGVAEATGEANGEN
jgi:chromosome segregation ATPase